MLIKLALIFFGLLFLVCIWLGRKERVRQPLEGEKITVEDAMILLQALDLSTQDLDFWHERGKTQETEGDEADRSAPDYMTFGQYIEIL